MKVDCNYYKPFKGQIQQHRSNEPDSYYMYYKKIGMLPSFKEHKTEYIAGIFASIAAIIALSRFAARKMTPKNIVEIADKTIGLNKPNISVEFAESAKEKILYPIMSVKNGQWYKLFEEKFANGMIIAGDEAYAHSEAFIEHAEELGIKCIKLDPAIEGKQNIQSGIYKIIDEAKKFIKHNPKNCVVVYIGNIDKAFTMNKSKSSRRDISKVESKLTSLPRGIIWSGWTQNCEKIPYYYRNTPTKIFFLE